ncbi:MAG TPA: DUF433 domain-containing protein [Tepidisphaeraceae bacterium]|jgi:uncharacterized protein (DUF433 family)|nr:DUF433 domain-containing protein [Tepidisphaeraceae bacterium]
MTTITTALPQPSSTTPSERIPTNSAFSPWISVDPNRMHGEPCFKGTRVPVQILFDHLRNGSPIADFLEGFPDVARDQAIAVIDLAGAGLIEGLRHQ